MAPKVYIDGHVGTTGLRIREWLVDREDLELLTLEEVHRKVPERRREMLKRAGLVVLCLPDAAARETVSWLEGSQTRIIDASTAHRTAAGWVYGLPELEPAQRIAIAGARRVSNPGCYPTAVVLAIRPLLEAGLVASDLPLQVHALSGYSGGGRAMIERWEDSSTELSTLPYEAPYALDAMHKHIPEMQHHARLTREPQFVPAVGPFRCGMRVQLPLHRHLLSAGATGKTLWDALNEALSRRALRARSSRSPSRSTRTRGASIPEPATTRIASTYVCCRIPPVTCCCWLRSTTWERAPQAPPSRT